MWSLNWGDKREAHDRLMVKGFIKRESDLEPDIGPFGYYIDCFHELDTCRDRMTISPIPFTSIAEFAKLMGIEDFEEFLYLMRRLDNVYLKHCNKEDKSNGKADKNNQGKG